MDGQSDGAQEHSGEYDTVDVYEILQVLKKRYKLIAGIFLVSVALAVAAVLLLPPVYRVSATLAPGWLGVTEAGNIIYIASPEAIGSMVENEVFNAEISKELGLDEETADELEFHAVRPKNTNVIILSIENKDTELGINAMEALLKQIIGTSSERLETRRAIHDSNVESLRNNISEIKNKKLAILGQKVSVRSDLEFMKKKIALLEATERSLLSQVVEVEANTKLIVGQREGVLNSTKAGGEALPLLLYSNTIQQNISYIDRLRTRLDNNLLDQEASAKDIVKIKQNLKNLDLDLKNRDLEIGNKRQAIMIQNQQKAAIEGMKTLQKPTVSPKPVKPRKKLVVALAGFASLFFGVFLAFFMEWLENNRRND